MSDAGKNYTMDLSIYETEYFKFLNVHFNQINCTLSSVRLAVINYSADNENIGDFLPFSTAYASSTNPNLYPETVNYVTRLSLIGLFASVEEYFRQCYISCKIFKNAFKKNKTISGTEFNNVKEKEYGLAKKLTFGKLVNLIGEEIKSLNNIDLSTSIKLEEQLNQFIKLRNCVAHRMGFVSQLDCNEGDTLSIEWNELRLFAEDKHIDKVPFAVEGGQSISARYVKRNKTIQLGERIEIEPSDVYGVSVALLSICRKYSYELIKSINQYITNKWENNSS